MSNELRFDGKVAIVTGAGNGLGRSHALLLGSRGAKVVVNDLGGSMHGGGGDKSPAEKVVAEIKAAGGEAIANADSVVDGDKIVQAALDAFGGVDIIVNNAGILRDTSFQKMSDEDWDLIYRVHVLGTYKVTKAAWNHMRDKGYGRIVNTASAAGIYGNFGQANYAMAKLGIHGFTQTLALEGKKKNVLVNTIAPIAGSRLTETVLPPELVAALKPEVVSPLVALLAHESSTETGGLFEVGGGYFAKLRWERTKGKMFPNGRPISIENVKKEWGTITSFKESTTPTTVAESMQPILENVQKKSLGGNDLIDVDQALGYEFPPQESSYDERDLALYALSTGAAENPTDEKELAYVYEMSPRGFQAQPAFASAGSLKVIIDAAMKGQQAPGLNYGFERILHGEQYTMIHRPLPPNAKLTHKARVKEIWDKGKNAIVVVAVKTYDADGELLFENELSSVVRGAGGWGGERGPASDANAPPDRPADKVIEQKTDASQALLFRLNGDRNPLHADPNFAKNFGFDKPILHGLCTFGFAARHAIQAFADGDGRTFKSIRARFAESVFPGETIVSEMWKEGDKVLLRAKVKERDKVVLSNTVIEFYKEIPQPKAKAKAAVAAAAPTTQAAAPAALTSGLIFEGVKYYVEKNPDLAGQVKTSFQFNLTGAASNWYIDLKSNPGVVNPGALAGADVTLELSESDFVGMATGKLNPQKLYFGGQLKISGNVMASQKLEFLQKIDGEKVRAQMAKEGRLPAAAAGAPAAAAAPAADGPPNSADVFAVIGDYISKNADLVGQVNTIFQFKLTGPDSTWIVDLKNGKGAVTPGAGTNDCALELSDADFLDMTSGKADPQKLYFAGKLKISGNVMASQKLMFLKKIDPKAAADVIAKSRASGAPKAAAAAATPAKAAVAKKVFDGLADRIAKDAGIQKEIGAVLGFKVTDPSASFVVDLSAAPGKVSEGDASKATTTFTLKDETLEALAKGESARDLFQRGHIRVDGEARLAQKLGILKGL
ncbi:MAG: SDR family NAD(P)-dependent oxidoreductase [Polyangiaceae bacterium]